MSFVNVIDIVMLSVILLCAGDAVRMLRAVDHPIRSTAFGLVTIGSFGWIVHDVDGGAVRWWALCLHAGFALYAVLLFAGRNPLGVRHEPARRTIRPAS